MKTTTYAMLMLLACILPGVIAGADKEPARWNKERAAKYLDERAKDWFGFSRADRGTGTTATSCVCCHTIVPYALARPLLREDPKKLDEHESKLISQIEKRVDHWQDLDHAKFGLMYDSSERKKRESRGTEAVINAFLLARNDRNLGRKNSSASARKAFDHLWQTQIDKGDDKGSWDWLDFDLEPWESQRARYFGATLAALAVSAAPGYYKPGADAGLDAKVKLLRGYLHDRRPKQSLHHRIWLLWAASKLDGLLTPDERKKIVGEIFDKQRADGGWNLASLGSFDRRDDSKQPKESDGYATGLVLFVLQTSGLPKKDPKVEKGLAWLNANQRANGAWTTASLNKDRDPESHAGKFMSDAATAFAVMALSKVE